MMDIAKSMIPLFTVFAAASAAWDCSTMYVKGCQSLPTRINPLNYFSKEREQVALHGPLIAELHNTYVHVPDKDGLHDLPGCLTLRSESLLLFVATQENCL